MSKKSLIDTYYIKIETGLWSSIVKLMFEINFKALINKIN